MGPAAGSITLNAPPPAYQGNSGSKVENFNSAKISLILRLHTGHPEKKIGIGGERTHTPKNNLFPLRVECPMKENRTSRFASELKEKEKRITL